MEKASSLGIKRQKNETKWTEEEDLYLKNNYPSMGFKCRDGLPDKTHYQIKSRIKHFGLKYKNNRKKMGSISNK